MTKICPSCGRELPHQAAFCPWCEQVLVEKIPAAAPRPRHKKRDLLAAVVLFILCLLVLPKVFNQPSSPTEAPAQKTEAPPAAEPVEEALAEPVPPPAEESLAEPVPPPAEETPEAVPPAPVQTIPEDEAEPEEPVFGVCGTCSWTLHRGVLTFVPLDNQSGTLDSWNSQFWPWAYHKGQIREVRFSSGISLGKDSSSLFEDCWNLTKVQCEDLDTSQVQSLNNLFRNCENLVEVDVSNWDVSNVTQFSGLFWNCKKLAVLDVSRWDTSSGEQMEQMFSFCHSLTELDVSNWDVSNVSSLHCTFAHCYGLTSLDVSQWDTGNVLSTCETFNDCTNLVELDVSNWDMSQNCNMGLMFQFSAVPHLDLSQWDTSCVREYGTMFQQAIALQTITVGEGFTIDPIFPATYSSSTDGQSYFAVVPGVSATYTRVY